MLLNCAKAKAGVPIGEPKSLRPSVLQGMVSPRGVVMVGGQSCGVWVFGMKLRDSCGLSLRFTVESKWLNVSIAGKA